MNMLRETELGVPNKKIMLLFIVSIMFLSTAAAHHYDFPDGQEVVYGESTEIVIECDYDQGACRDAYSNTYALEMCGEEADSFRGSPYPSSPTSSYEFEVTIPSDAPCGYGESNQLTFNPADSSMHSDSGGSVDVIANSMHDHIGENIIFNAITAEHPMTLRNFQLTDDIWDSSEMSDWSSELQQNTHNAAGVMVQYYRPSYIGSHKRAEYAVRPGDDPILDVSNVDSVRDYISNNELTYDQVEFEAGLTADNDFTTGNSWEHGDVEGAWNIDSQSPIHSDSRFWPDGDIAIGRIPQYYINEVSAENFAGSLASRYDQPPYFFVCREGAEMSDGYGGQTGLVVDADLDDDSEDLYKCEHNMFDGWHWSSVGTCQDGLDNDGDGDIDGDDVGCIESNSEYDEIEEGECEEPGNVIRDESEGDTLSETLFACYESGGEIQKESFGEWDWTEVVVSSPDGTIYGPNDPETFTCDRTHGGGNCPDFDEYEEQWDDENSMPAVRYGAHAEHFVEMADTSFEYDLDAGGYDSKFVSSDTGWTTQVQPLFTAEKRYDQYQQIGGGISEENCAGCHEEDWWDQTNISDPSLYDESVDANDHVDTWLYGNAGGAMVDQIVSQDDEEDSVFQGGWYGECDDEFSWRYSNEEFWACEGIDFVEDNGVSGGGGCPSCGDDPVSVPGFGTTTFLPDTEIEDGERDIGIIQLPYFNKENRPDYLPSDVNTYRDAVGDYDLEDNIERMNAMCWAGTLDDKPDPSDCSNNDACTSGTVDSDDDDVWGFHGTVDTQGSSSYACSWDYESELFNPSSSHDGDSIMGDEDAVTVHLHRHHDPSPNEDYFDFWEDVSGLFGLEEDGEISEMIN